MLEKYTRKRDLSRSKEPPAIRGGGEEPLVFVVQKHAASHLHYDFRLELNGVLKSWAVPKGPSLDPEVKRLAMQVEDHPFDYRNFEGIIPPGNYGAGSVIVWDEGRYQAKGASDRQSSEAALVRGLARGELKFVLEGSKLAGEFALVRLRGDGRKGAGENSWLLIKKQDRFATSGEVTLQERSVVSGLTVEEVAAGRGPGGGAAEPAPERSRMPHLVSPMLATPVAEPFDDPDWVFEIKLDGYRALAELHRGEVLLYSRNATPFTARFPEVARQLGEISREALLDGEIVALDATGRSDFQQLQNYGRSGVGTIAYFVFDLLHLDGRDLTGLPLLERKRLLGELLPPLENVRFWDHLEGEGTALFRRAVERGLEGVVAKRAEGTYQPGRRSREWLKIRNKLGQEAIICGYTPPRGSRSWFGALVLGAWERGELVYIGLCGGGFDERGLREIHERLQPLVLSRSPFREGTPVPRGVTWVRPHLVCQVSFTEWTVDRVMRHPVFLGMRDDKEASAVVREIPGKAREAEPAPPPDEGVGLPEAAGQPRRIHFTNRNKVFWPDEGYTKGDVIEYYRSVADVILPYLVDRPQSLYRTPDGIAGEGFFQKDAGEAAPGWVRIARIYSESNEREISYILCQDRETLLYMANLGCIEINPWLSRIQNPDNPDYVVIDLDPEGVPFARVIDAALAVRRVLERGGIAGFPKTSGASGMHIHIPLGGRYDYATAGTFAQLIAHLAHNEVPEFTSLLRSPAKRRNRVYLDYLQNRRGQTVASPYSIRPRPGATVSTPLEWDEVAPGLDPGAFTIRTIHARLEKKGDLFAGVLGEGIDMVECLKRLEQS